MPSLQADFDGLVQAGLRVMYDVTLVIAVIVFVALTIFLLDAGRKEFKTIKRR